MATSFGPNLGHHQPIIIQESEYIEKLKTIKRGKPQNVLKINILA